MACGLSCLTPGKLNQRFGSLHPAEIVVQQNAFGGCSVFLPIVADFMEVC